MTQAAWWRDDVEGVVHDLRHPLAVISGYADFLEDGSLGELPPQAQRAVAAIVVKTAEMGALINSMLDLSRSGEAGLDTSSAPPLNLCAVADDAVERAVPRAAFAGDEVRALENPEAVPVRTDPAVVGRVLDNLINNALGHGRHPGRILIAVRRRGAFGEISVADDGDGLPDAVRDQLFGTDGQGTVPETKDVGLGLRLSIELAKRLGGSLRVERAHGRGAAFVLSLPLAGSRGRA